MMTDKEATANKVILITAFILGLVMVPILLYFSDYIISREVGVVKYSYENIEFQGDKTFWKDGRQVILETEDGLKVYPTERVTFQKGAENNIEVTEYEISGGLWKSEYVTVTITEDEREGLQNNYVRQFGENIGWKTVD